MKPSFVYVVFNRFFVSDFLCETKKLAVRRVRRLNDRQKNDPDYKVNRWRFQRIPGISLDFRKGVISRIKGSDE